MIVLGEKYRSNEINTGWQEEITNTGRFSQNAHKLRHSEESKNLNMLCTRMTSRVF